MCLAEVKGATVDRFLICRIKRNAEKATVHQADSTSLHHCRSFTLVQLIYFSISLPMCSCGVFSVCRRGGVQRVCGGETESGDKGTEERRRRPTGLCLLSNYASPVSYGSEKMAQGVALALLIGTVQKKKEKRVGQGDQKETNCTFSVLPHGCRQEVNER